MRLAWLALMCAASAASAGPAASWVLLTPAPVLHGNEVGAQPRAGWWGLLVAASGGAAEWRAVTPAFRRVPDPVLDTEGATPTGVEIRVPGDPLFIVRGSSLPAGGPVKTLFARREGMDLGSPHDALPFDLKLSRHRVAESNGDANELVLADRGRKQVLYRWPDGLVDQHAELHWAGDLDRDGRLDLFLVLSDHSNVMEYTLLLSSLAKPGELVGLAARFRATGC